jgi:hypothetical protein
MVFVYINVTGVKMSLSKTTDRTQKFFPSSFSLPHLCNLYSLGELGWFLFGFGGLFRYGFIFFYSYCLLSSFCSLLSSDGPVLNSPLPL